MYDIYICGDTARDRNEILHYVRMWMAERDLLTEVTESPYDALEVSDSMTVFMLDIVPNDKIRDAASKVISVSMENRIVLLFRDTENLIKVVNEFVSPQGLLKMPASYEDVSSLLTAVEKTITPHNDNQVFSYTLKAKTVRIPYNNILYFESRAKKTYLITSTQEHELYIPLDELEESLGSDFVRIHRSFLVNKKRISEYNFGNMTAIMDDGSVLLISRSGKARLKGDNV